MTMSSTDMVPLIPREVMFGNPERASPRISPDGTRIAYLAPLNNVLNVWISALDGADARPVTHDSDRGVRMYFWAEDNQHIVYLQDVGGNENWRIFATELASGETRDLTPFDGVQARLIDTNKRFPTDVLVALNRDNPQLHDAYRLDLASGELTLIASNPGAVASWLADAEMTVRGAGAARPDGGTELLLRDEQDGPWRTVRSWDSDDAMTSAPVSFSRDGRRLYLRDSLDANSGRLVEMDVASGSIRVIAEDPQYDIDDVVIHPDTYEAQAVSFYRERKEWVVLDTAIEADFAALREVNRGDLSLLSRDSADQVWIVAYIVDDGPVSYYAYDRRTRRAAFLFVNQPALAEYPLAQMKPIQFTARDGLIVHGYLTMPTYPHDAERRHMPLVLNVHGGPWGRDGWGYDPEAQWLANRGYACLQVNFRGSTGYGKDFVNAGDREWGGKMHDDLADAVAWAVAQGYADPARVAIYGGSYGGYAALVGATFTPDLFCCAVDIVGPSNLITLIQTIPPYWAPLVATFHKRVGSPETDEEFLKSRSPLFKVDAIKIPVLIAQGANDPRVKQAESEQIVEAMKRKGIPYDYMLFPDEGHGFAKPENRLRFYAAAERFLAHNLGGRVEEEAAPAVGR